MRSKVEKDLAIKLRHQGNSYRQISNILSVSKDVARNLCRKVNENKNKTGPKSKISKYNQLSIKREVMLLKCNSEKVNSAKIQRNCGLNVSRRTIRRYLSNKLLLKYRKISQKMVLTNSQKNNRISFINDWIGKGQDWYKTIFTDEKIFYLDGPDDYKTYVIKNEPISRQKRICGGGKIMVWLMTLPNGLVAYKTFRGTFDSTKYIDLLKNRMLSIINLNMDQFWLQYDNSRIHTANVVKHFLEINNVKSVSWPPYSADLNIVEDVWSMVSEFVYDGYQFQNYKELEDKIARCVLDINKNRRNEILKLYSSIPSRLIKVIMKKGNLWNK